MPPQQPPAPIEPPQQPAVPPEQTAPQQQSAPTDTTNLRQQIAEQLKNANNVLVTVSANPSVDQLAGAIGLTLVLNKMGKHAAAVFSGQVPSTIEFLQPEKTLEKNTDSLRDFIIALDKAKADKLRYKVEDKFVKIFITPYHTALSQKDLEFSQGEFNVDVVVALGVKQQAELDQAITAHGRILHDAAVISINYQPGANLGAINLNAPDASSLSEIVTSICKLLKTDTNQIFDAQIATALLTGIVAETNRFSNNKTKPRAMSTAAELMNAGANQQLIATKLEEPKPIPKQEPPKPPPAVAKPKKPGPTPTKPASPKAPIHTRVPVTPPPPSDGSLQIKHDEAPPAIDLSTMEYELEDGEPEDNIDKIHIDDQGRLSRLAELQAQAAENAKKADDGRQVLTGPDPTAKLSANTQPQPMDPTSDAMSLPQVNPPLLEHQQANIPDDQTLDSIEKSVNSPHINSSATSLPDLGSGNATDATPTIGPVKSEQQPPPGPGPAAQQPFPPPDPGMPADQTAGTPNPGAPPPVPPPLYAPPNLPGSTSTDAGDSGVPL